MSGYNYNYFVSQFAKRTLNDLNMIYSTNKREKEKEKGRRRAEYHEVTMTINSLFGLLIFPSEMYKDRDENTNGEYKTLINRNKYASDLLNLFNEARDRRYASSDIFEDAYEIIRHMRNSLAHSGNGELLFVPIQENREITSVIFRDKYDGGKTNFCVELTVDEILQLTSILAGLYNSIECQEIELGKKKEEQYKEMITECRKLFDKRKQNGRF